MARLARFVLPGQPQHVIVRGNNREPIFYAEEDYLFYLEKLQQACDKHRCDVHAYVLMTSHVHLLMTPIKGVRAEWHLLNSNCLIVIPKKSVQW